MNKSRIHLRDASSTVQNIFHGFGLNARELVLCWLTCLNGTFLSFGLKTLYIMANIPAMPFSTIDVSFHLPRRFKESISYSLPLEDPSSYPLDHFWERYTSPRKQDIRFSFIRPPKEDFPKLGSIYGVLLQVTSTNRGSCCRTESNYPRLTESSEILHISKLKTRRRLRSPMLRTDIKPTVV